MPAWFWALTLRFSHEYRRRRGLQAGGSERRLRRKIQFETTTYEFGKIKTGDPARHDFIFTNTGFSTLQVLDVTQTRLRDPHRCRHLGQNC